MKLAIMQPYLFPYVGYFQLIKYVDKFVVYDDAAFIKQGWINRNRILLNGKDFKFTVPLKDASSSKSILETEIDGSKYDQWKNKFYLDLAHAYEKAPYFYEVFPLIKKVFDNEWKNISLLAVDSIKAVCSYLKIKTELKESSIDYNNNHLFFQERLIDICHKEQASVYVNLKGGASLFDKSRFEESNINLLFIESKLAKYQQFNNWFVSRLSIIDAMMFNNVEEIHSILEQYEIS